MNVEALIAYLGEWLKALVKSLMQTFAWIENLPAMLEGTTAADAE